jgi:hypothetical protein
MIVGYDYLKSAPSPEILALSHASKRDLKALILTKEEAAKAAKDPIWCLVLSQGPGKNYCDHCFVYQSDLFKWISKGAAV